MMIIPYLVTYKALFLNLLNNTSFTFNSSRSHEYSILASVNLMLRQTTLTTIERLLADQIRKNTIYEINGKMSHLPQSFKFDQTQQSLFTTTLEGLITFWTNEMSRFFQYSSAEILGKDISILFRDLNHNTFLNLIADVLKNGRTLYKRQTIMRKNGDAIDVDFCHSPLRDKDGNIIGIIHACSTILHD